MNGVMVSRYDSRMLAEPFLPRHTGEVPPKGAEGEGHTGVPENFRSEISAQLD